MSWICIKRVILRRGKPDQESVFLSDYKCHETKEEAISHGQVTQGDGHYLLGEMRYFESLGEQRLAALFIGDQQCLPIDLLKARLDLDL